MSHLPGRPTRYAPVTALAVVGICLVASATAAAEGGRSPVAAFGVPPMSEFATREVARAAASLGCAASSTGLLENCRAVAPSPASSGRDATGVSLNGSAWIPDPLTVAPSPRYGAAMVYDLGDGYVLLFGGATTPVSGGVIVYGDTWIFAGTGWTNISSIVGPAPPPRVDAGIAYDDSAGYVVMFGGATGYGGRSVLNDTWTYRNDAWTNVTKGASPSPRTAVAMAYDPIDSLVVLFGGCVPENCTVAVYNDTWVFAGGVWSEFKPPAPIPGARGEASMAFDTADGYVLLFGGSSLTVRYNDTWEFRGGKWTPLHIQGSPSAREIAGMDYDPAIDSVVLFGGKYYGDFYADTWLFHQGNWTSVSASLPDAPTARGDPGLVYDPGLSAALLLGGETFFPGTLNDTWLLTDDYGTLSGSVTPKSATVVVDGDSVAVISGSFRVQLLPGDHTVQALLTGYQPQTSAVNIHAAETSVLTIALIPNGQSPSGSNSTSNPPLSTTAWVIVVVLVGVAGFFAGTTSVYRGRNRPPPPRPPTNGA